MSSGCFSASGARPWANLVSCLYGQPGCCCWRPTAPHMHHSLVDLASGGDTCPVFWLLHLSQKCFWYLLVQCWIIWDHEYWQCSFIVVTNTNTTNFHHRPSWCQPWKSYGYASTHTLPLTGGVANAVLTCLYKLKGSHTSTKLPVYYSH